MYIFKKYQYFLSFDAGNCVSESKVQLKQFSMTRVNLLRACQFTEQDGPKFASSSGWLIKNFAISEHFLAGGITLF